MEEKYFIIDYKNKECGAFTEDELNYIGLYEDSLIFCAEWSERKPLNEISELSHVIRKNESILTINSQYGKNIVLLNPPKVEYKEEKEWMNPYSLKNKRFRIIVVSCLFFHLMALFFNTLLVQEKYVSVYTGVGFISYTVRDIIWPFETISRGYDGEYQFSLFSGYDKTEFIGYNLIFGFIWFLLYTNKQKN
jgi:hypothetical protein